MSTTVLVAEILVVGAQAMAWLLLAGYAVVGPERASSADLQALKELWALWAVFFTAFAYAAGVVVDRVADSILHVTFRSRGSRAEAGPDTGFGDRRMRVRHRGGEGARFLDYVRSRLRVARGSALNLFVTSIVVLFLPLPDDLKIAAVAAGVLLCAASIYAWVRLDITYDKRLGDLDRLHRQADERRERKEQA